METPGNTEFPTIQQRMDERLRCRIQALPRDVQLHLLTFLPRPRPPPPLPANTAYHLKKMQASPKRTSMDLKGLEDFVLK